MDDYASSLNRNHKITIKQHGSRKNLQSLLLIHGWGFNSNIWQYNLEHLSKHYNIYTLDLNGHGDNKYNQDFENLDLYIDIIIDILNNCFTQNRCANISILGWSLGGIIALKLKFKYPNIINKIILCCSNPCFISNPSWEHGVDKNIWDKFKNNLITNQNKTIKEFLLLQTLSHHNSKNIYKQLLDIHKNSTSASLEGLKWGLNILNQDHRHDLRYLQPNDLSFILGNKDRLVNKSLATWLKNEHPSIKILELNKSGHMPFITEPDLFHNHLENFLN